MARTLLAGQSVLYDGDPLRDLTLASFLEKFVQKKAKVGSLVLACNSPSDRWGLGFWELGFWGLGVAAEAAAEAALLACQHRQ